MTELPDSGLMFDEASHVYTLRGLQLPSVTQIMKPLNAVIYNGVPDQMMMVAADRGTRAHSQVEAIVKYGVEEFDEDTEPYVRAFQDFQKMFTPTWIASEYKTYHKNLRYAGMIDLIGYVEPDDGNGIDVIDLKTTASWHPVLLGTQLSAYAEALKSHGIKVRNVYGLQVTKYSKFRFEKLADEFKTFLHCMGVYNAAANELLN
ncbi:MAG: PD-(D/E)XK nuclease family protein [Ruminococcus sp.]|nr:PD-(D/E)XK nuclease family protein [Ruminococcus sp.]